jgi:hypothetical protein
VLLFKGEKYTEEEEEEEDTLHLLFIFVLNNRVVSHCMEKK